MSKMSNGLCMPLPRTTSPLVTLLQKKRATALNSSNNDNINNNIINKNNINSSKSSNKLSNNNNSNNNTNNKDGTSGRKPLKYSFNFSLNNNNNDSKTTKKHNIENTTTNKTTTPINKKSPTTASRPTITNSSSPSVNRKNNYNNYNTGNNNFNINNNYNNTRFTPNYFAMDKIRENIVNGDIKHNARATTPPDARYSHPQRLSKPNSIEFYEPGTSSLAKDDASEACHNTPPLDKPGDLCRYIVSPPSKKYNVKRARSRENTSPPLRPPTPHGVYMSVQKGGEVPLEGLYCPPFLKPDLSLSTRKSRWHKEEALHKRHPQTSNKPFSTPCLPVPSTPHKASLAENVSLCELLATSRLNCKDRRSRDEINKARKLQMDLYIKSMKLRKRLEEERDNEGRRHCDQGSFCKSPVPLDRYDLEDEVFSPPPISSPSPHSPQPAYKARALYPFQAKTSKELSLQRGDVVYVWGVVDENWMKGEHHGNVGIFPSSYVQIFQSFEFPLSTSFSHLYSLLYTFQAQTSNEISLKKGDIVRVLERVNGDWARVELLKPSSIRQRSPEASLYNASSHRPSSASALLNTNFGSPNYRTNSHHALKNSNTTHFNNLNSTGLVPCTYIIPLERNIETMGFSRQNSPFEWSCEALRDATRQPAWKDVVVGVGKGGIFFTDDHNASLSRSNRWKGTPSGRLKDRKAGLYEELYSPQYIRKFREKNYAFQKNCRDKKMSNNNHISNNRNTFNKTNINKTDINNNNNTNDDDDNDDDPRNDLFIDEAFLSDLQHLNASIDPLFYLNLAKIKPQTRPCNGDKS